MPPKAIPPARDRLQSQILVATVAPLLCGLAIAEIAATFPLTGGTVHHYQLVAVLISVAFALFTWLVKAATPAAAVCGGLICLLLTNTNVASSPSFIRSGLPPLALLFFLTFAATRYGRTKKEARGLSEARTGRRASQVIANLGVAAFFAAFAHTRILHSSALAFGATLAALAEATADTLSSEIGQTIGGQPFLITTFRRVPPGTDGAISLGGTLVGLLGAAAVVYIALPPQSFKLLVFLPLFAAATAGLFFDSLLGATLERRGYIGNDLVNFSSTAFAAAIFYPLAYIAMSFLRI